MCPYLQMTQLINSRFNDQILKICCPLMDYLNLKHFWYYKLTDQGVITFIGSHADWIEQFAAEKFFLNYPFVCHPKYQRSGVSIRKDSQSPALREISHAWEKKYGSQQSLVVHQKHQDYFEEFGFVSGTVGDVQTSLFMNEMPLFQSFIRRFKKEKNLIAKLDEVQINIANLVGPSFYEDKVLCANRLHRGDLLRKLGFMAHDPLSERELEVLKQVILGSSAAAISVGLVLSKRTVEHHIERIRAKLGCDSKAELIQKGRELESLGCLE